MKKEYCVYVHTNVINGRKYVGMTSQAPERRWRGDGSGYKQNAYFTEEIKRFGWNNFKHEIVAVGMSFEEACEKEIEIIKLYDTTNREKGYNEEFGGLGKGRASETMRERNCVRQTERFNNIAERKRQSKMIKQYFSNPKNRERQSKIITEYYRNHPETRKPVQMFTLSGELVSEFGSAWETGRYGFDASHVKACCKGKRKTTGGYIWRYANGT